MSALRFFVRFLFAPLYNRLVRLFAYGAWGPRAHHFFILIFCRLFQLPAPPKGKYRRLGDFFLRDVPIEVSPQSLVSPAESVPLLAGHPASLSEPLRIKAIDYQWSDFVELQGEKVSSFFVWNLYLAPQFYHWVHFPCDLEQLETQFVRGASFPVNRLGLKLCPKLYSTNERLCLRGVSPIHGRVYMIGIAALAVSCFEAPPLGFYSKKVSKADKAFGFKLGSSVLLLVEKLPKPARSLESQLKCGESLVQP